MSVLLSEYENGHIHTRVFRLNDDNYQVLVYNNALGNVVAEFFKNYDQARIFAESRILLNG
jgi:hypothetical protein